LRDADAFSIQGTVDEAVRGVHMGINGVTKLRHVWDMGDLKDDMVEMKVLRIRPKPYLNPRDMVVYFICKGKILLNPDDIVEMKVML
jgi:hypothetical protein